MSDKVTYRTKTIHRAHQFPATFKTAKRIPSTRDNIGSLLGMIGELTCAFEESARDYCELMAKCQRELERINKENSEMKKQFDSIEKIK